MQDWRLVYDHVDPAAERLRETLCTLGNGYVATRGAAAEARADEVHYPGTYLAGGYNRLTSAIAGQIIEQEDLVNLPNWLCLTFRLEDGDWLDIRAVDIQSYRQTLHLKGHIFWDELFIFPTLNLLVPEITRALLLYRYRRLPEARWAAGQAGYEGAMYPWQSSSNGQEESQTVHLNPSSGRWIPDNSHLQMS